MQNWPLKCLVLKIQDEGRLMRLTGLGDPVLHHHEMSRFFSIFKTAAVCHFGFLN